MSATPSTALQEDHRPPRILIIDDNPSIHRDFELVFLDETTNADLDTDDQRLYGIRVAAAQYESPYLLEHAQSGLEGVEKVTREMAQGRLFQLAFVDIRMPGMDGVETIERLWRIDPRIQVVICTAYADYSQEDLTRRLGQTDKLLLLKKPFDSIEVTQLARTLTEKWYLALQAALKLEQMELLVAQRTQRLLELQRSPTPPLSAKVPEPADDRLQVILLIQNHQEFTPQIGQLLAQGHQVVMAQNAAAGFDTAREIVPDLIIADIAGPQIDGVALCRRLKADVVTSHIPVILVALRESADRQIAALAAGADDFLAAPLNLPCLRARVLNLLESRRHLRSHLQIGSPLNPRNLGLNQAEARFLQRTIGAIEQHLSDFEFDIDTLARLVAVSRRQLFRKVKALVDMTPKALIRSVRLKRAAQLLAESKMTVTEITFAVGFLDVKYFRELFREEFGVLPSEYTKQDTLPYVRTAIINQT